MSERKIGPWKITASREIHHTPWLKVREDQIIWPDGRKGDWTVIDMQPAVGIVALTDDQQVHLVGQHRYAVDRYEWEIPAGCIDEGEDLLAAARRELREETGLTANKWTSLGATHPHNSSCSLVYHMYLAEQLEQGQAAPDETEMLSHKLVPLTDIFAAAQSGECMDSMTAIAVLRAWNYLHQESGTFPKLND